MTTRPPIDARPVVGETTMVLPWTVSARPWVSGSSRSSTPKTRASSSAVTISRPATGVVAIGRRPSGPMIVHSVWGAAVGCAGAGVGVWPRPVTTAAARERGGEHEGAQDPWGHAKWHRCL